MGKNQHLKTRNKNKRKWRLANFAPEQVPESAEGGITTPEPKTPEQ